MEVLSFWNNKGGTGKTSLVFQTICGYAAKFPEKKILVVDLCPQANLSELFLGGQENRGSEQLFQIHGSMPRKSIGGYFDNRLSSPFSPIGFTSTEYIVKPSYYNDYIDENIDLVCGDPLVELQVTAMNSLANTNIPMAKSSWLSIIDWLNDFLNQIKESYDIVFIDTNPSFSIYTQIALAASDGIIVPVMADDSSRRAFQNVLSLLYGIKLPAPVYQQYTFSSQMQKLGQSLPTINLVVRNRITQYMGDASAYSAVLEKINIDLNDAIHNYPQHFKFLGIDEGMMSMRDFQTTGVVALARGCPFNKMEARSYSIGSKRVRVTKENLEKMKSNMQILIDKI